jgi:O-antigen/teichoic acid export membrane protein
VLFRRGVIRTAAVLFGLGVGAIVGAAMVGPAALGILYGDEFSAERLDLTLLGVGVAFYLVAATVSQALLALAAVRSAAAAWSASAIVFLVLYFALHGGELLRISAALAVATTLGAIALVLVLAIRLRR